MTQLNEQYLRMQKLAGVITENEYKEKLEEFENLEEGWKDWIVGGLIAATTLAGIGKVYQINQQQKDDEKAQTEYYNKVLANQVNKMSEDDLEKLGLEVNTKTKALSIKGTETPEELHKIFKNYASSYIKANPQQFAVGTDGSIYHINK